MDRLLESDVCEDSDDISDTDYELAPSSDEDGAHGDSSISVMSVDSDHELIIHNGKSFDDGRHAISGTRKMLNSGEKSLRVCLELYDSRLRPARA